MVLNGTVFKLVPYGPVRSHRFPYGPVLSQMVLYGPIRSPMVSYGPPWVVWSCMVLHMIPYGAVGCFMVQ